MSNGRTRRGRALGLGAALALFAIICGLVLLLASPMGAGRPGEVGLEQQLTQREKAIRNQVGEAIKVLTAAEGSLGVANYGAARHQMALAKQKLAVILFQLDGLKQLIEPKKKVTR